MHKSKKKTFKSILGWLLTLALLFTGAPIIGAPVYATATGDGEAAIFEATLSELRETFFENFAQEAADLEVIEVDTSRITHVPQEYLEPEPPSLFEFFAAQEPAYAGPFSLNDTRVFRAQVGSNSNNDKIVLGKLIGQGTHTNIWVLDDTDYHQKTGTLHNSNCHLNDINAALAQRIAVDFDAIYVKMTANFGPHTNVQIKPGYGNCPTVGDIAGDGKVNFLLYDIYGDGGSGGSFTAGFFSSGDFFTYYNDGLNLKPDGWPGTGSYMNSLDMLHIDIGHNQGYTALASGSEEDRLSMYDTLAHEFQHLLFYMYFGIYMPSGTSGDYSWINEALSELAGTFYVKDGTEIAAYGRLRTASQNSYANGANYGDLLNFNNSLKNYGMSKLFSMMMYKKYGGTYTKGIYDKLKETYPPAQNYTGTSANQSKISSEGHDKTVGRFLNAGSGVGTDMTGFSDTLPLLYYLFMENFAADGGKVEGVQTTKFYDRAYPADNLWAIRPVAGVSNGIVFTQTTGSGSYYSASGYAAIPQLQSGGTITLTGYGSPNTNGASHEMLYKLTNSANSGETALTITAPNDGNMNTRYYAVIANNELITSAFTYTSGAGGADVYSLTKGTAKTIDTEGRQAYLLVSTLYQNVSSSVAYSWLDLPPLPETYPVSILTNNVTINGVTAEGTVSLAEQEVGQSVTVAVTLTGTAIAAGTHTVGLSSTSAGTITAPASMTKMVTAGQAVEGDVFDFTFTMPENAVTDLVVTHTFNAAPSSVITSVAINIPTPVAGEKPGGIANGTGNFTIGSVIWSPSDANFKNGTQYTVTVNLTAKPSYTFDELCVATINGETATINNNTGYTIELSGQFIVDAGTTPDESEKIKNPAITVIAPVTGEKPDNTANGTGAFTASTAVWSPGDAKFKNGVAYTATVRLTASAGYTFDGLSEITMNDEAATGIIGGNGKTLTVSRVFTAGAGNKIGTTPAAIEKINNPAITVIAPAPGDNPNHTASKTAGNFSVSTAVWSPGDAKFKNGVKYTVMVRLTANAGYTFDELSAATINGNTATVVSNTGNTLTLSYEFTTGAGTPPAVDQKINNPAITVIAPTPGDNPSNSASKTAGNFTVSTAIWSPGDAKFKSGVKYTVMVRLTANTGYTFDGLSAATINGNTASVVGNTGKTVTISYTFVN